jgi:hypothetical protein
MQCFLSCSELYWFTYEEKAYKIKLSFGVHSFKDPPLCTVAAPREHVQVTIISLNYELLYKILQEDTARDYSLKL